MCPYCFVTYCDNCFKSVIDKENKCWACERSFHKNNSLDIVEDNIQKEVGIDESIEASIDISHKSKKLP